MAIEKILIVDDEMLIRNFLAEVLKRKRYEVTTAENGKTAMAMLKDNSYDMVITDMKMPDITGIEVLRKVKEQNPSTIVIIITAYGSIENAVEAMKLGAFNYLIKPFSPDSIEAVIHKAQEHLSLVEENQYLRQQVNTGGGGSPHRVIGESAVMKKILSDVKRIAQSNASVFISGESGTGKEVISAAIHHSSPRAHAPFIRVNCAAVPDTLVESEFFGHEKGAFTGANLKRKGRFELADGGSLLLDEITEIPIGLQAKLLRVIQEREFERVGGAKVIRVDTRLISTSNRDMKEAIDQKVFREDLYYRLNVVPICLPPLRDRRDDVILLAEYFLERMCLENHQPVKQLNAVAKKKLLAYHWPGNIRELANIIERAVVLDLGRTIDAEHLYIEPSEKLDLESEAEPSLRKRLFPSGLTLREVEKRLILETLETQSNNRTRTAEILGISIRTLRNKLHEYRAANKNIG